MDLLKYMAPKGLLKRFTTAPIATSVTRPQPVQQRAVAPRPQEPIKTIVDRYEANLPSIHKLICLNRELLLHRQAELEAVQTAGAGAVRSFRNRLLGALPLGTLALQLNQLSQAGLASAHADSVVFASGTAAVMLACMSVVSLGSAVQMRRQKAVLAVRQEELQGAIERETRAASRTLVALNQLRHSPQAMEHDITQVIGADAIAGRRAVRPQAFSDVVTPPPGWPRQTFAKRPMPMDNDVASGTTFQLPH